MYFSDSIRLEGKTLWVSLGSESSMQVLVLFLGSLSEELVLRNWHLDEVALWNLELPIFLHLERHVWNVVLWWNGHLSWMHGGLRRFVSLTLLEGHVGRVIALMGWMASLVLSPWEGVHPLSFFIDRVTACNLLEVLLWHFAICRTGSEISRVLDAFMSLVWAGLWLTQMLL